MLLGHGPNWGISSAACRLHLRGYAELYEFAPLATLLDPEALEQVLREARGRVRDVATPFTQGRSSRA